MTAEERASRARQIVSDYLDRAFGATFLTPTEEGMVDRIAASLTEAHAAGERVGKAAGEETPLGHAAVEAECVHRCLDDRGVPRSAPTGEVYSLWGRVEQYRKLIGSSTP
jgi:hypothetical protein